MSDRTLNWGESEAAARYQTGDSDPDGGDFIVAKNTDNETVLLQFDNTAEQWVFAGDVDLGGNDLQSIGLVETGALVGSILNRPEAIDNLEGNIYVEADGVDPETVLENDGDIVFIYD